MYRVMCLCASLYNRRRSFLYFKLSGRVYEYERSGLSSSVGGFMRG